MHVLRPRSEPEGGTTMAAFPGLQHPYVERPESPSQLFAVCLSGCWMLWLPQFLGPLEGLSLRTLPLPTSHCSLCSQKARWHQESGSGVTLLGFKYCVPH